MTWLEELKINYLQRQKSVFIAYGNTADIWEKSDNQDCEFADFLMQEVFASRQIAIKFNIGTGLQFRDKETKEEFQKLLQGYDTLKGTDYLSELPSDIGEIFRLLNRFLRLVGDKKSIVLVIEHAELLIPQDEMNRLQLAEKKVLVTLDQWAKSAEILSKDISIVLICDNLYQIQRQITSVPEIAKIKIDFPNDTERLTTVQKFFKQYNISSSLPEQALVKMTAGLNRKSIRELFLRKKDSTLESQDLKILKKTLVEEENSDFIEFIESEKDLEMVAGHDHAKRRLRDDAALIKDGNMEVTPMGYLICGPVGTGKSFLAECFAGEAGIPFVKIKNFRDRWVGSSEANFEKVLTVLKNLSPVVILIDEADAALGDREGGGDSGVSKRIFSMLAQEMGDSNNRGKLIWMLLTSRPELLPVDLKRQGRAEVHIPLFYPKNMVEKKVMIMILGKKVGFDTDNLLHVIKEADLAEIRSGADIESVLIKCKRFELLNKKDISPEEFSNIVRSFRSSLSLEEINKQIQAALDEVTDTELLGTVGR